VVPGDLQTQILKKNCLIKTKDQKKEDYNIVLKRQTKIIKVKDDSPSPFYSGTYHPPVFSSSLAALFCLLKVIRKKEVPMESVGIFSTL